MSSVVSYKTSATNQTRYSHRSDTKSASGYSRAASAYSQKRRDMLEQEHRKELDEIIEKQLSEQERHKKLMQENKRRMKAQQDQLKKEVEVKKQQDEELLKKMKEDKKSAYVKYLKENSKELLQNFKKKEGAQGPSIDDPKSSKNSNPPSGLLPSKVKSTPADSVPYRNPKQKQLGGNQENTNSASRIRSGNNGPNIPKPQQRPSQTKSKNTEGDAPDNLEALDLDINRSTNNFQKIIDQYYKDMEHLRQQRESNNGRHVPKVGEVIPLEQFYGTQMESDIPLMETSKVLEGLDLGSSVKNWNPSGRASKTPAKANVVEPEWGFEDDDDDKKEHPYGYYSGPKRVDTEQFEEKKFEDIEKEIEELIETHDHTSDEDSRQQKPRRVSKKLERISDVSQKQTNQDWYRKYTDGASSVTGSNSSKIYDSAKGTMSNSAVSKVNEVKSLSAITNPDQHKDYVPAVKQHQVQGKLTSNSISPRQVNKPAKGFEKVSSPSRSGNKANNTNAQAPPHWGDQVREDDFYKALDRKVPSRERNQENQGQRPHIYGPGASSDQYRPAQNIKPAAPVVRQNENYYDAGGNMYEDYGFNMMPQQKPGAQQPTSKPRNVPEKTPSVASKKREPSVTKEPTKKTPSEQSRRKESGLKSKLQGHVKAANNVSTKVVNKKGPVKKGARQLSPTTRGTRDTDLDVEEFLEDDFRMLNQEEANLQNEIVDIHMREISKVKAVEKKYNINPNAKQTNIQAGPSIPYPDKAINEEDIEDSLDRLDFMLAKQRGSVQNAQAPPPINPNLAMNPYSQIHPSQQSPINMNNGGPSLYNHVMQLNQPVYNQHTHNQPTYNPPIHNQQQPPYGKPQLHQPIMPPHNHSVPNPQANMNNRPPPQMPQAQMMPPGYGMNPPPNNYAQQPPPNMYNQPPPNMYSQPPSNSYNQPPYPVNQQMGAPYGMNQGPGNMGYGQGAHGNVKYGSEEYSPDFGQNQNSWQPPQHSQPSQPVNKPDNQKPYNQMNVQQYIPPSQAEGYGAGNDGYRKDVGYGREPSSGTHQPQNPNIIAPGLLGEEKENYGGLNAAEEEKGKSFTFNTKQLQANLRDSQKLKDETGSQANDKASVVSAKFNDQTSEVNQSTLKGDTSRMTVNEGSSYAAKKQQQKDYKSKKAPISLIKEDNDEGDGAEGKIKIAANAKHLLFGDDQ